MTPASHYCTERAGNPGSNPGGRTMVSPTIRSRARCRRTHVHRWASIYLNSDSVVSETVNLTRLCDGIFHLPLRLSSRLTCKYGLSPCPVTPLCKNWETMMVLPVPG